MNVLVLVHHYVPDRSAGAETHLHAMCRALAGRGHRVDVSLSRQDGEPYVVGGVAVWPTVDQRNDHWHLMADADVLVTHLENTPRVAALGKFNGLPVVAVHHNTFTETKRALLAAQARVDMVVVNSMWMAADLEQWMQAVGADQPPTVVVRPTVDVAEYATTPGDRVTLVNMRCKADTPAPLTKGGELFRVLAERLPHHRFLGVKGAYGAQQDMGGLANVDVVDHVPHHRMRDDVFARTRVLLMPSNYESWGRVGVEAMCSGIPVVANPTPGLVESLGPAGIFIDLDDVDGWATAADELMVDDAAWAEASAKAKARAVDLSAIDDLTGWCDKVEALSLTPVGV